jgi:cytochrome P450
VLQQPVRHRLRSELARVGYTVSIDSFDITGPRFKANPYPFYARLRDESPVCPTRLPDGRVAWLVTRYDDVATVLAHPRFAKDRRRVPEQHRSLIERSLEPLLRSLQYNMLFLDPPDHTRLRGLVHKAFTPRLIERLRERMQLLADHLLDDAVRGREFDLVGGYALPIPATVIADLLGVPATDRDRFHRWSSDLVSITSGRELLLALPSALLFMRYLRRLFAVRRVQPRDDLTTALVQAEESGDHLSADELLSMVFLLLVAGHETTVNLISGGTLALLEQPDQLQRLRQQPELLQSGSAVEELLRFTSPVQVATERYAREAVELSATVIPRGALVLAMLGSANRDERQFVLPDQLDLGRTPNPHLAFGQSTHYCLGAPLARLEAQIAFSTLVTRLDLHLSVPPDRLPWRRSLFLRGLDALPLSIQSPASLAA